MLKTCRDQWSKPAPSSRPLQDSLTALTTELRAVLQQQPRNVRISSTLLPGMSGLPSPPFLQRGLILSPPLFWTCHIPSTQFSEMSVTALALFLEELGVSGTQFSKLSDSPTEKTSSIKPFPHASSTSCQALSRELQNHRGSLPWYGYQRVRRMTLISSHPALYLEITALTM